MRSGDGVPAPPAGRNAARTVTVVLTAGLLAMAFLTHFAVGPGRLAAQDKALMGMQRMGPPPRLQAAYNELDTDTVAIRNTKAGHVIADGIFAATFANPQPGSGIKHFIEVINNPLSFAVFITALSRIRSLRVFVNVGKQQFPGSVILADRQLGLAAIKVTSDQMPALVGPPPFWWPPPAGALPVPQLILRLIPDDNRSAGYALASGLLSGSAKSSCNAPVSASEAGAPVGVMSAHHSLIIAGLASPSAEPGRCSILGGWIVDEFMRLVTLSQESASTGAHLGVVGVSTAAARAAGTYRGRAHGDYITVVEPGTAAVRAGLQPGDVVVAIAGRATGSPAAVREVLRGLRPGTRHTVTYVRGGRVHTVSVILGGWPGQSGGG